MEYFFDRSQCLNLEKSLTQEWLLTNGTGSYASSSLISCNTRKYHGLLNVNLAEPPSRYVLLSTLEETLYPIANNEKKYTISTREHPDLFYPMGYRGLSSVTINGFPSSVYTFGDVQIRREVLMVQNRNITLVRYLLESPVKTNFLLNVRPLFAFREMHKLTFENNSLNTTIEHLGNGKAFTAKPYNDLPAIYMYTEAENEKGKNLFCEDANWYKNIHYQTEKNRGFDHEEDLFSLGHFELPIQANSAIYIAASTEIIEEELEHLWVIEATRQLKQSQENNTILKHLEQQAQTFVSTAASKDEKGVLEVVAGYPWFQAWGRDTLIALPGLCFATQKINEGKAILENIAKHLHCGLLPNMFSADGNNSYNTVDASLWFVWAVQNLEKYAPNEDKFIRKVCFPAIKKIIGGYARDAHTVVPDVFVNRNGLLHTGNKDTQLTWMDAIVDGKPVTPRFGFVVEINALWYNALAYAAELGDRYGEDLAISDSYLASFRTAYKEMFWTILYGGYLGDVATESFLDLSIRPNQIFAVSLPYSPLNKEDQLHVMDIVRTGLLTPYGLRTLSRRSLHYKGRYEGNSSTRDAAYHQGTAWPWLLGAYVDALLKTTEHTELAVKNILQTLTPLFSTHLREAGIGSISEIFSGDPPQNPDGCIAQAWSVGECYRLLLNLKNAAPEEYDNWEKEINNSPITPA